MILSLSSKHARISFNALLILSVLSLMVLAVPPTKTEAKQGGLLSFFLPLEEEAELEKLASKSMSLEKRHTNEWVNNVFKDNILLTVAYLSETQTTSPNPDWNAVQKPFTHTFTLKPGEVFAFHDTAIKQEYEQHVVKTTNARYSGNEGFRSSGKLMGDGVCHLASLFYWAAKDAGLEALSPVNHDFAVIPEIDKKYGVAIYSDPTNAQNSMNQNLYIRNNQSENITFQLIYNGKDLTIDILKDA